MLSSRSKRQVKAPARFEEDDGPKTVQKKRKVTQERVLAREDINKDLEG